MLVYVRPSNEVANDPSKLARYLFRDGELIGVQRGPSEAARCASTEDHQAPPPLCSGGTGPTWVSFQSFLPWGLREQGNRPHSPTSTP
jgi:hypothetical protein